MLKLNEDGAKKAIFIAGKVRRTALKSKVNSKKSDYETECGS